MVRISRKPTEIEPWLLLNVSRKSLVASHLKRSSASPNHRKGPKWPSATSGRIFSQPLGDNACLQQTMDRQNGSL